MTLKLILVQLNFLGQFLAYASALDDNDDVQGVYANFDISDVVLSELAAD